MDLIGCDPILENVTGMQSLVLWSGIWFWFQVNFRWYNGEIGRHGRINVQVRSLNVNVLPPVKDWSCSQKAPDKIKADILKVLLNDRLHI